MNKELLKRVERGFATPEEIKVMRDFFVETLATGRYEYETLQCLGCPCWYTPRFLGLPESDPNDLFIDRMEEITGLELLPTYSFARRYVPGHNLAWHRDRHSCEISLTLCVSAKGESYPLIVNQGGGDKSRTRLEEIHLAPGDAVIYNGHTIGHGRKFMQHPQEALYQLFVHYVDADGEYADYAGEAIKSAQKRAEDGFATQAPIDDDMP